MSARERLTQLIDLASGEAPGDWCGLARELADVLVDWPEDYPAHMRPSFALLLEKIASHLEAQTRTEIGERLAHIDTTPPALLNEFFFDCGREGRDMILARVAQSAGSAVDDAPTVDEPMLVKAARDYPPDIFLHTFARLTGVPAATGTRAIGDGSGEGLAILCKGARVSRSTFSTIVLLTDASLGSAEHKLEAFDSVSDDSSATMVQFWRLQRGAAAIRTNGAEAA
ncbi:MAG: DUF2336 domain-containing protein [Rhizomicrobium sp.]